MKAKRFFRNGCWLVIAAALVMAIYNNFLRPATAIVSQTMPVVLIDTETGDVITSKLTLDGTWHFSNLDFHKDKLRLTAFFRVNDIPATLPGGGSPYEITFAREGEEYITTQSTVDTSVVGSAIHEPWLRMDLEKARFLGVWDIFLSERQACAHYCLFAPARSVEEAETLLEQFSTGADAPYSQEARDALALAK